MRQSSRPEFPGVDPIGGVVAVSGLGRGESGFRIADPHQVDTMLDALIATDWVVYSKPCITHTETVVDYLGRYSRRIALSDRRLLAVWPSTKARSIWPIRTTAMGTTRSSPSAGSHAPAWEQVLTLQRHEAGKQPMG